MTALLTLAVAACAAPQPTPTLKQAVVKVEATPAGQLAAGIAAPTAPAVDTAPPPAAASATPALTTEAAVLEEAPALEPTDLPELLSTPDAAARGRKVRLPVLMYHYVDPQPENQTIVERGLTVSPADFAQQMQYLHDRGYVTVSLYDLEAAVTRGQALPPRAVVITFDGGRRRLLDYAVPVMRSLGFTGTLFVITGGLNKGEALYVSWEQAKALYAEGWKIEPHTRTHQQLAGRDAAFQTYEIQGSQQDVAAHLGVTPRFLAYPAGQYDALTLHLLHELGFWGALTTRISRWHTLATLFTMPRVRINGTGTFQDFKTAIDGDLAP